MGSRWMQAAAAIVITATLAACGGDDGESGTPALTTVVSVDSVGSTSIDATALSTSLATYPLQDLSTAETQSLTYMRQEERLAHDVYSVSATLYPQQIFDNISAAEDTHSAAVLQLLVRYQLPDPLAGLSAGIFPDTTIQGLYTQFALASQSNLTTALQVGVQIEELDIHDLSQQLVVVDNADIEMVYENLMKASRNHLRSFMKVLTQQGGTYTPQYLTQVEFDAIVNSPMETGH